MHDVLTLYRSFAARQIDRREFLRRASALGIAGAATSALGLLASAPSAGSGTAGRGRGGWDIGARSRGLELLLGRRAPAQRWRAARWSTARRCTSSTGSRRRSAIPYPIVIVHGGGGQGLDWLARPDGGPGWVTYLLQEGYRVYLVDRPGHGRSPFHPELHGQFPAARLDLRDARAAVHRAREGADAVRTGGQAPHRSGRAPGCWATQRSIR